MTTYKHLEFENSLAPPTKEEIAAIEAKLGVSLPADFRTFLDAANGADCPYIFDLETKGEADDELSFGIYATRDKHGSGFDFFIGKIESEREFRGIPDAVLPFAGNGSTCFLYLDLTPEGNGSIIAFRAGLPAWTGRNPENRFIKIASSFDEFVAKLRSEPEY